MNYDNLHSNLERYHKECYGWALHCCHSDKHLAEDVLQTSYLKILEKQKSFKETSEFKTWAFAIIRNTAIDEFRKRKKEYNVDLDDDALHEIPVESETTYSDLPQEFFEHALLQLSERQRQIVQLVFYHELSLDASAEVMNITPGAARKYYDRAKKNLAEWFRAKGIVDY